MQEQNFEKQVQQKMDELSLTPSAPVWQKVEREIRRKKERRRTILWTLPLFLLLGAGILWISDINILSKDQFTASKQARTSNDNTESKSGIQTSSPRSTEKEFTPKESNTPHLMTSKEQQKFNKENGTLDHTINNEKQKDLNQSLISKPVIASSTINSKAISSRGIKKASQQKRNSVAKNSDDNIIVESDINLSTDEGISSLTTEKAFEVSDTAGIITANSKSFDSTLKEPETITSTNTNTDSSSSIPKQKKSRNWAWSAHATFGTSAALTQLFSGRNKSLESYSAPAFAGNAVIPPPSPARRGLAFSAGLNTKKQLNDRIALSGGLQYSFFSTHISVGTTIYRDTFIQRTDRVAISQYYTYGRSTNYTNKYHFIEIPIGIEWQVSKKLPMHLHSGFSINKMVATNALVYDRTSGIYYQDKGGLIKTQVHAFGNLTYRLLQHKGLGFHTGPYIQYGISKLQKDKDANSLHLFSAGLRTYISF